MPDRLLRDELWESERYLDLQTDTQRLAFIRLLSAADDFGNLAGGARRIYRLLTRSMHVKGPEEAAAIITALQDVDLVRCYTVVDSGSPAGDVRELIHIPRFRSHRQYMSRKVPPSPWCSSAPPVLGKDRRRAAAERGPKRTQQPLPARAQAPAASPLQPTRSYPQADSEQFTNSPEPDSVIVQNQQPAEIVATTSMPRSVDVAGGVGVGEEEEASRSKSRTVDTQPAEPPARPPAPTRAGAIAALLRSQAVMVTSMMPCVQQWASDRVSDAVLIDAVERCRLHKPAPTTIPWRYYATVVQGVISEGHATTRASPAERWWASEAGTVAKGAELGVPARPGEVMESYRERLRAAIAKSAVSQ